MMVDICLLFFFYTSLKSVHHTYCLITCYFNVHENLSMSLVYVCNIISTFLPSCSYLLGCLKIQAVSDGEAMIVLAMSGEVNAGTLVFHLRAVW